MCLYVWILKWEIYGQNPILEWTVLPKFISKLRPFKHKKFCQLYWSGPRHSLQSFFCSYTDADQSSGISVLGDYGCMAHELVPWTLILGCWDRSRYILNYTEWRPGFCSSSYMNYTISPRACLLEPWAHLPLLQCWKFPTAFPQSGTPIPPETSSLTMSNIIFLLIFVYSRFQNPQDI